MMSNIFQSSDSELEMGGGSKKKKIVVCPLCKNAMYVSVNWISGICSCNNYFNLSETLTEDEALSMMNRTSVDRGRLKLKYAQEKKVEDWIVRQKKKQ